MLIYLVSATLFVVAGVFAGLEALGVTFPAEGWVSGMSILFVYGLGLAAIPAVFAAVVVIVRLWRDPEAWIPSALWLVTVAVAVAAASRPAPPGAAPGEPSGTMEYVALGCLCLYTFAAGYSGLRWLVMKSAGPEAPAELQR
jgi:hypothetical protein